MYTRINSSTFSNNSPNKINGNNQNYCLTLPVTCHICLGKVKDPSVCPNLHVFCSFCIEIWLEKTKQCPTCRIQINKENPCRRILGGVENFDEVDVLKPCEFSNEAVRKARYLNLFQQYEEEINRLNKYIDSLNVDIAKLKDCNHGASLASNVPTSPQHDMLQILKDKLKSLQSTLDQTVKERDGLKESNKKLESENSILIQEMQRLKANLNERNSQLSSKYTLAAMESKLEGYEKEVKQLQKALEKSDKYIAELESKQRDKENGGYGTTKENILKENSISSFSNLTSSSNNIYTSTSTLNFNNNDSTNNKGSTNNSSSPQSPMKFIKGDNQTFKSDLKIVKFSEKIDTIQLPCSPSSSTLSMVTSPPQQHHHNKQTVSISNDKFYGSPSKLNTASSSVSSGVMSFSERMKKNALHFDSNNTENSTSSVSLSQDVHHQPITASSSHQFLFSPMKRLRLDEQCGIDLSAKQNSNYYHNDTNFNLTQDSPVRNSDLDCKKSLKFKSASPNSTPVSSLPIPHSATPYNFNYTNKSIDYLDEDHSSYTNCNNKLSDKVAKTTPTTTEFIDCIELLNKAEKKVQNRQVSPKISPTSINSSSSSNDTRSLNFVGTNGLPDKYFRAVNILENASDLDSLKIINDSSNTQQQPTLSLNKSLQASFTNSSSSSSSSSGNSLSANISSAASNSSTASAGSYQSFLNASSNFNNINN